MIKEASSKTLFFVKNILSKNKKEVYSSLFLFTIFSLTSYILYPHESSKTDVKGIATSNLPQKQSTTNHTSIPNTPKRNQNKNLIIYYPNAISPTVTPSPTYPNPTTEPTPETSSSSSANNTTPTATPTPTIINQQSSDSPIVSTPTPTIIQQQSNAQPTEDDTNTSNQVTATPNNTEEKTIVGTVVQTVGTLTSNVLPPNQ